MVLKNYDDVDEIMCLDLLKDFEVHFNKCRHTIDFNDSHLVTLSQEQTNEILAYALYHIGQEGAKTLYIEDFDIKLLKDPHSLEQIILTETLCLGIKKVVKKPWYPLVI